MSGPTPLPDVFKRGEAPRDARLLAAQGSLAPRPHEQLALLVLLADDPDPETRETADRTMKNDRDLSMLWIDRNVPEPLRIAARRKVVASTSRA